MWCKDILQADILDELKLNKTQSHLGVITSGKQSKIFLIENRELGILDETEIERSSKLTNRCSSKENITEDDKTNPTKHSG
jgi:hypothetical protein